MFGGNGGLRRGIRLELGFPFGTEFALGMEGEARVRMIDVC